MRAKLGILWGLAKKRPLLAMMALLLGPPSHPRGFSPLRRVSLKLRAAEVFL